MGRFSLAVHPFGVLLGVAADDLAADQFELGHEAGSVQSAECSVCLIKRLKVGAIDWAIAVFA